MVAIVWPKGATLVARFEFATALDCKDTINISRINRVSSTKYTFWAVLVIKNLYITFLYNVYRTTRVFYGYQIMLLSISLIHSLYKALFMLISFFVGVTLVVYIKQKALKPNSKDTIIMLIADGYKALIDDVKKVMK